MTLRIRHDSSVATAASRKLGLHCLSASGADTMAQLDALMADPRYGLGGSEVRFDSVRLDEMVPEFLAECLISGHYYALPYMRSTEACYINKTYVEKLGYTVPDVLTWDFVWEVSEAAMAQDAAGNFAVNGQKVMIPFIYKSTDNMMITLLKQQEAGYSTDAGEILIFNETTAEDLREIYEHGKSRAFSTFKISSYPANFLNAGQCVFAIDSTAGATWMGSEAPLLDISEDRLVRFRTEVRPIPQFDPEHPKMISCWNFLQTFWERRYTGRNALKRHPWELPIWQDLRPDTGNQQMTYRRTGRWTEFSHRRWMKNAKQN